MAAIDELSQLKRLILGQEQQSLERLQERVERPATRAQDVAEVLVESFELNNTNTNELAEAMRAPVQRCISDSVRKDPEEFADALFPVIGPAIRKAVRDSISALSEKINRALERSFSLQGLKWRVESMRTGVPVAGLILRDSFIYRVDQAFVIQRHSGLLIAHEEREGAVMQDSDAVSAMLTAIQDFVRDSFSAEDGADLDTIRLGGEVVWLFHGPHAITAAIINGQPPRELRLEFEQVTENIHRLYGEALEKFDGTQSPDQGSLNGISALLKPLLAAESHQLAAQVSDGKRKRRLYFILGLIALIVIAWLLHGIRERSKLDELVARLEATPGLELISLSDDKPYAIRAFRDPLAPTVSELLSDLALTEDDLRIELVPFQSLAPEIVVRRLQGLFDIPPHVVFEISGQNLLVKGNVPPDLRARLGGFPLAIFGLEQVDFVANAPTDNETINQLREELNAPEQATFSLEEDTAYVGGLVPIAWVESIDGHEIKTPGVRSLNLSALSVEPQEMVAYFREKSDAPEFVEFVASGRIISVSGSHTEIWRRELAALVADSPFAERLETSQFVPVEREEMRVLADHINAQKFYFIRNDQFAEESRVLADRLANDISRLAAIDELLGEHELSFEIRAFADTAGTPEQHAAVRKLRAEALRQYLVDNGIREAAITIIAGQPQIATDESMQWRRAEIQARVE